MLNKHRKIKNNLGFTLVELAAVICIIGILASISIIGYGDWQKNIKITQLKSDLNGAVSAMENARNFGNGYPSTIPATFKPSNGTTLSGGGLPGGKLFCLTAKSGTQSYSIDQDGKPLAGGVNLLAGDTSITKTSANEFLQYADIAPIIDTCGLIQYTISFDIKSANITGQSTMRVYNQNGSTAKYSIGGIMVPVTTSYSRQSITVIPTIQDSGVTQAMLAFYGTYGTGNIPSVKNVKVEFGPTASPWAMSP